MYPFMATVICSFTHPFTDNFIRMSEWADHPLEALVIAHCIHWISSICYSSQVLFRLLSMSLLFTFTSPEKYSGLFPPHRRQPFPWTPISARRYLAPRRSPMSSSPVSPHQIIPTSLFRSTCHKEIDPMNESCECCLDAELLQPPLPSGFGPQRFL